MNVAELEYQTNVFIEYKEDKNNYKVFKSKTDAMNMGVLYDTPKGALMLAKEIPQNKNIKTSLYGFILETNTSTLHLDINALNETYLICSDRKNKSIINMPISEIKKMYVVGKLMY